MSQQFFDRIDTTDFSSDDPESILNFLNELENQFQAISFTDSEWNVIHGKITSGIVPVLVSLIKDQPDLVKRGLDIFRDHVVDERISKAQFEAFYHLATVSFKLSTANKVRISGLELLQALFSKGSQTEIQAEKVQDFVRTKLFTALTASTRPMPSLIQAINSTIGLLCKYRSMLR